MFRLTSPGMELALDRFLDDPEEITGGIADAASLAAGRPFVEHRLLQGVVHPLKCDQCAGLLFLFQGEEALRQTKVF